MLRICNDPFGTSYVQPTPVPPCTWFENLPGKKVKSALKADKNSPFPHCTQKLAPCETVNPQFAQNIFNSCSVHSPPCWIDSSALCELRNCRDQIDIAVAKLKLP